MPLAPRQSRLETRVEDSLMNAPGCGLRSRREPHRRRADEAIPAGRTPTHDMSWLAPRPSGYSDRAFRSLVPASRCVALNRCATDARSASRCAYGVLKAYALSDPCDVRPPLAACRRMQPRCASDARTRPTRTHPCRRSAPPRCGDVATDERCRSSSARIRIEPIDLPGHRVAKHVRQHVDGRVDIESRRRVVGMRRQDAVLDQAIDGGHHHRRVATGHDREER